MELEQMHSGQTIPQAYQGMEGILFNLPNKVISLVAQHTVSQDTVCRVDLCKKDEMVDHAISNNDCLCAPAIQVRAEDESVCRDSGNTHRPAAGCESQNHGVCDLLRL